MQPQEMRLSALRGAAVALSRPLVRCRTDTIRASAASFSQEASRMTSPHLPRSSESPRANASNRASVLTAHLDLAAPAHAALQAEFPGRPPSDLEFVALRAAYRTSGGVARGDDLARTLWDRQGGDYVSLARLIVAREIFCFRWGDSFWLPMFQFERGELSIKPGLGQVLGELTGAFDGWNLAVWFAQSNAWLHGARPVDLLDSDLPAVREAARADRFVVNG
jgi:hypothetical protein